MITPIDRAIQFAEKNLDEILGKTQLTTKITANRDVQFDTCTVSYTCQTVRHVHFDTRITRGECASHKLHNLTRVFQYACQTVLTRVLEYTCQIGHVYSNTRVKPF
jgi:hypothetical protein